MSGRRGPFHFEGKPMTMLIDRPVSSHSVASDSFDAEGPYLSAAKKLVDTKHPAFRAVTAIRGAIVESWRARSLPFPEPGVRLIRLGDVDAFDRRMADFRADLDDAVANLD